MFMNPPKPGELYHEGKLTDAIKAAREEVKQQPTDTDRRWLLCELLCFAGELARAEGHLDTLARQDPKLMFSITMFRNLIRAENARRQFYAEGKSPEIFGESTPSLRLHLDAAGAVREERLSDAFKTLTTAEEQRVHTSGVCDGETFDDLRDADDLTASVFEAFTVAGKYCWIPIEQVSSVEFKEIKQSVDLLWREVHLVMSNGFDGQVYLPVLYHATKDTDDDQLRWGRGTDWLGDDTSPVRGIGQRVFVVGDQGRPILELNSMKFEQTG